MSSAVDEIRPRPWPALAEDAHKGDAGRVLCIAGSAAMPGAAILTARAAQRAGAGLAIVGCVDRSLCTVLPQAAPEAVLLDLSEAFAPDGGAQPRAAQALEARAPHARLVGPGMGDCARTRAVVRLALAHETEAPLVLDADGLNALDGRPERLHAARAPLVLTPHPGEAERLAGEKPPADRNGRVEFARELARRTRAVVCLKGRGTVVADEQRVLVNPTGNAGMATAGTGDVLAGILVAYLAALGRAGEGWDVLEAAAQAVYLHGLAGDLAAARIGRQGLVASDLIRFLPEAERHVASGASSP